MAKSIIWALENAPRPLSASEITDHFAAEGGVFDHDDVRLQFRRVQGKLNKLRSKGIVKSEKVRGSPTAWSMAAKSESHRALDDGAKLRLVLHPSLSDDDWALIRRMVPNSARQKSVEAVTRQFIEAVFAEYPFEGNSRLKPREQKRFLVWQHLGVWSEVATALNNKMSEVDFARLADRLLLIERA